MEATENKIEHRHMTEEEKAKTAYKAVVLLDEGKEEEAFQLIESIPMSPHLAKNIKDVYGADYLANSGFNLLEAEKAYGKKWLYN
jgi:hypothetical protein